MGRRRIHPEGAQGIFIRLSKREKRILAALGARRLKTSSPAAGIRALLVDMGISDINPDEHSEVTG